MTDVKDLASLLAKLDVKDEKLHVKTLQSKYNTLSKKIGEAEAKKAVLQELLDSEQYSAIIKAFHLMSNVFNSGYSGNLSVLAGYEQYAKYKVGKEKKFTSAADVSFIGDELMGLEELTDLQRQLLHIYAQNWLKKKEPKKAYQIYEKLLAIPHELDNAAELTCNKEAAFAECSELFGAPASDEEFDAYDILFNKANHLCSIRDYDSALQYAEKAFKLAQEEDTSVDDLRAIKLQLSYIHQLQGHKEEAKSLLNEIISTSEEQNDLTSIIAKTNFKSYASISKFKDNIPLILRELDVPGLTGKHSQISYQQQQAIASNLELLKVFSNGKIAKGKTNAFSVANQFYTATVGNVIYEPYENQANALCKKLEKYLRTEVKDEQRVLSHTLVCVQVLLKAGNLDRAIIMAERIWNHFPAKELSKYKRILSYVLLNLYDAANRSSSTAKHLAKLLKLYSEQTLKTDPSFWEFVGFKLLEEGQASKAEDIFRAQSAIDTQSKFARYVAKADANALGSDLDSSDVQHVIADVDVDSLLKTGISAFENVKNKSAVIRSASKKKRRVHKKKELLKSADESKQLDPERWLPLKERSAYRVSKKNIAGKNTQGFKASKASEAKLDITKKAAKKQPGKKSSAAKSKASRKRQ
ncbi:unnamed protein product [Kluyveromyces dobzhanskii CBS 2104]|uniref:Signal recognition particle subunit SRP72 n=1 Tax=Kluyveromyces dobzhanskii CBS 2104 TaxID=1427455 RepID=A0A0A8L1N6_9SACH|nr:unnamed protein product [Kluyveromyces dobzhanskii CBS 2104]